MPIDPIVMMTATDLSGAIHARQVSCVAVMEAYLGHIETHNPRVNAIVSLRDRATLVGEARERDRDLATGGPHGWMHGFPAAVKDLEAVRGLPWTQGSRILATTVADQDAIRVERMRRSGAVFIGKTNTSEFGLGSHTFNKLFGTTRNPYDQTRSAGGSSGGAGAALAMRMLPVADGTDHAGSLRNPAAFNNLFALRPSFGRVPAFADDVFSASLSVAGPMARTVEDLAMLLSVQAGFDPRAPLSLPQPGSVFAALAQGPVPSLAGKRIGWLGDGNGHYPLEPGILELCRSALATFEQLGCTVEAIEPPCGLEEVWENWLVLRGWTVSRTLRGFYDDPASRALLKPEAIWEVERGLKIEPEALSRAMAARSVWFQAVRTTLERFDALALPSAQVFPFAAELDWPKAIEGRSMDTYHRWMEVVIPGTMSGCPVIGIPAGFNAAGLPAGLQILCGPQGDATCLTLARAYDAATRWPSRRLPPALADQPGPA